MKQDSYYLRNDVFCCISDDHVVFLDPETDSYIGLPIDKTCRFQDALVGWGNQGAPAKRGGNEGSNDAADVLDELVEAGLLTTDRSRGKSAAPVSWPSVRLSLIEDERQVSHLTQFVFCRSFFAAARAAVAKLRASGQVTESCPWKITPDLLKSIRHRRERHRGANGASDLKKLNKLARVARELRPWFIEKPICTLDSLIVIEFFARHGIYPEWIFGVQANPLQAHCWVQYEDLVVNDRKDVIGLYTQIMAV